MKQTTFLLMLIFILCGQGFAQEKLSLTLDQAKTYALEHNRTLKNAELQMQKDEANRWAIISSVLPQINGSVDYANMMGYKLTMMGYDIAMPPYATIGVTTSVSLSAAQFIGFKVQKMAADMSNMALKKTELQIINQVKTLYFSVLVMNQTITLLDSNLVNLKHLLAHTENSVKVGILNQTDADKLAVQVVTVETSINSVRRSLEMLYNALRLQLGLSMDTEIELVQTLDELMNVDQAKSLIDAPFALNNNIDYKLIEQNAELYRIQLNMKKWAYAPSITAYHSYTNKQYFSDEPTMNMTPPNIIGISLKVPIFSSGNRYASLKVAQLDYKKQLNTLADAGDGLLIKHRQLKYNLTSALENLETQKKNIEVNQRVFEDVSNKFKQGMSSSLDVTTAGSNLILAQSNYVQTVMDLMSAQIALEELLQNQQ